MAVKLGSAPLAGFDQPLQLLKDCHRRIEHFLGVLGAVVDHTGEGPLDDEGRRALEIALWYFHEAAPRHTADEEESLFPRLRRSQHPGADDSMQDMARLEDDHRRADAAHQQVHQLGQRWLSAGRLGPEDREAFGRLLKELSTTYSAHIRLEEERIFEAASRVLTAEELREIGSEMERRRSSNPAPVQVLGGRVDRPGGQG